MHADTRRRMQVGGIFKERKQFAIKEGKSSANGKE